MPTTLMNAYGKRGGGGWEFLFCRVHVCSGVSEADIGAGRDE